MKTKLIVPFLILLSFAVISANAQSIRKKEANQMARIAQDVRSGELTRGEAFRLRMEQRNIRHEIRESRVENGYISAGERAEIRRDQRIADRDIYRLKHNARERF